MKMVEKLTGLYSKLRLRWLQRQGLADITDDEVIRAVRSVPHHLSGNDVLFELSNTPWILRSDLPTGAIALSQWAIHRIKIAASTAETNTLADPLVAGILVVLTATSVGASGSRVITYSTGFDANGDTTLTFNATRQTAVIYSVPDKSTSGSATGFRWEVLLADGTGGASPSFVNLTASGTLSVTGASTLTGNVTLGGLLFESTLNAVSANAGGGQGSATALTAGIDRITTVTTIGDSVKLPAATAGSMICVINAAAANAADIFPASGDAINGLAINTAVRINAGSTVLFRCGVAGTWNAQIPQLPAAKYTTDATGTQTVPAGLLTGAAFTCAQNTAAGAVSWTTRTATQMFGDMGNVQPGDSYMLLITNTGNNTVTILAGSAVTLTGTMTIATNTTRLFNVKFTSAAALVIQSVGVGTIS